MINPQWIKIKSYLLTELNIFFYWMIYEKNMFKRRGKNSLLTVLYNNFKFKEYSEHLQNKNIVSS